MHSSPGSLGARISRDLWRIFAGICHTPRLRAHNSCHFVMRVSWGRHEDVMRMSWGCHEDVMRMSLGYLKETCTFISINAMKALWLSVSRKLEPFHEVWMFHDYLVRNHFLGISPPNSWTRVLWWREWENERLEFYVRQTFDIFQLEANCKLNKKVRISPGWELRDAGSISIFQLVMSLSQYELVMIMNITFTAHR